MIRNVIPALLIILAGCMHHRTSEITFRQPAPSKSPRNLFENFPSAYITSNHAGEYDILLVNDTIRSAPAAKRKKPLKPVAEPPIQQAIHIHVFWRPTNGAMVRESSITNAIVHWYVFSPDGSKRHDMLHYEGAAFVKLDSSGSYTTVTIADGEIFPKELRGGLKDPVGKSRITGSVTAVRSNSRVKELLASLDDRIAGNEHFWTEARGE